VAYASLAELRSHMAIDDTVDDTSLSFALSVAQQKVDDHCGRTFVASTSTTVRTLRAGGWQRLVLDPGWDIQSTAGLIVKTDDNDDGTFETTWTISTDFELYGSGVGYNGATGWPTTELVAVGPKWWPADSLRRAVQITALWGWTAVPAPVKQATLIIAAEQWKLKDAPFGVAGFGEFGPIRVRDNPMAASLLTRYRHPVTSAVIA
jgi:hypothetical protein